MARTYTFKGSASAGYGYFAFIEDGQLVIGEDWGREGSILYRGDYSNAANHLIKLQKEAPKLYDSIVKYYKDEMLKAHGFDAETRTILFKVKLHMDNGNVHNVLVRGRFQSGIVEKLMPKIPEVLMLQTLDAREFAVRSEKIYAVEFVED